MNTVRKDFLEGKKISEWDGKAFSSLSDKMFCCEATFRSWEKLFEPDSPDVIEKLFDRLPYKLKANFVSISRRNETTGCSNFSELRKLLDGAARDAESF